MKLNTMLYAIVGMRIFGYANSIIGVKKFLAVRGCGPIRPKLRYLRWKGDLEVKVVGLFRT